MQAFDYKFQQFEPLKSFKRAPELGGVCAGASHLRRLRPGVELPAGSEGGGSGYHIHRPHRLHVRGQRQLSLHPLCLSPGSMPRSPTAGRWHRASRRPSRSSRARETYRTVPQYHRHGGRRRERGYRSSGHVGNDVPQPQGALHLLRQRVVRQYRNPDLADDALRRRHHLHASRQGDSRGEDPFPQRRSANW